MLSLEGRASNGEGKKLVVGYPALTYRNTSLNDGLLPYISRKMRNTREANQIANITDATSITRLKVSSQGWMVFAGNRIITAMGEVNGKSESTLDRTLSGCVTIK